MKQAELVVMEKQMKIATETMKTQFSAQSSQITKSEMSQSSELMTRYAKIVANIAIMKKSASWNISIDMYSKWLVTSGSSSASSTFSSILVKATVQSPQIIANYYASSKAMMDIWVKYNAMHSWTSEQKINLTATFSAYCEAESKLRTVYASVQLMSMMNFPWAGSMSSIFKVFDEWWASEEAKFLVMKAKVEGSMMLSASCKWLGAFQGAFGINVALGATLGGSLTGAIGARIGGAISGVANAAKNVVGGFRIGVSKLSGGLNGAVNGAVAGYNKPQ